MQRRGTVYAGTASEIDAAFATARRLGAAGVNVLGSPFLHSHRARIIDLAAKARRTARALGLTIPQPLPLRADALIP